MEQVTTIKKTFKIGGDIEVNRLGYGAMRITGPKIWGPPEDKQNSLNVLKRAVELGADFIDTADQYGPFVSEELIAEALYPYKDVLVTTKGGLIRTGPWAEIHNNASPEYLREALDSSMKRLKLEQVDLYQLHRIDPNVPAEKSFEFLKQAQQEGKVRHLGLSEVSVEEVRKAQEYFEVVSVQNMYSVDNRKWESVLDYCKQHNIAFIPWFPIGGGGEVKGEDILQRVADRHQATTRQIALSWLLHHADNILPIPGTSNIAHLEENMKAAGLQLTQQDMDELDNIK